jgi:hypothetical protein
VRPVVVAQIAVGVLVLIKAYMAATMPPVGDEAYYWIWGQKLDWSYFDHPPLHAWLLRVMATLFGWNLFALRALTWLTLGGTLGIFWLWAQRLKPEDPAAWFWPSAAIYLASPLFFLMSSIAFHDHLLIFLCIASAHCMLVFAEKWEADGRGWPWLYAGAALLGLAVLTKYNGVLFGLGLAVFFIAHRPLRPLWRSPHLYLAALLSVALQAPVLWWNANRSFVSYEFHLSERWGGIPLQPHLLSVVMFLVIATPVVSPLLFPSIVAIIRRPLGAVFADRARVLALAVFAVSSLTMLGLSAFIDIFFYWNITAFLLLMPLLAGWMRNRLFFNGHLIYGAIVALVAAVDLAVVPIGNLAGHYDWTISSMYGWPQVAARVEALRTEHPVGFVAATRYTTAAQLAFAMHDPEVTAISDRHDQYDLWFDPKAHQGQDALVISDSTLGLGDVTPYFDQLVPLETVPYAAFGQTIYAPTIYLGKGFHTGPSQ